MFPCFTALSHLMPEKSNRQLCVFNHLVELCFKPSFDKKLPIIMSKTLIDNSSRMSKSIYPSIYLPQYS